MSSTDRASTEARSAWPAGRPAAHRPRPARGDGRSHSSAVGPVGAAGRPSSFVGRAEQVTQLGELLDGVHLLTLTGAPGIGKSRLALEVAGQLHGDYPDGAPVVELVPIARSADVPRAVASALSLEEAPGRDLTDTLVRRLRRRRLLLVLDNCEHVLAAASELIDALLRGCPELRVLATSREPLALPDELVWRVPPLSVPGRADAGSPAELGACPAVRLFVERAAAVQPSFVLSPYVAPAVAEVCRRLDGIPLAIELAAARVESLTPAEIARRLDDRFALLKKRLPDLSPRHQTLEAALDWSYGLLSEPERTLLRRLSVFAGGFELEAVEAVCAGTELQGGAAARADYVVPELLARLASKSLVVAERGSPSTGRFRLLETIRAYAAERLDEAGETAEAQRCHVRFYLTLAERAEPDLTGSDQERWLERLEAEHADLRSALEWSLSHGEVGLAQRLGGALVLFWRVRCHFSEGRELLAAAVSADEGTDAAVRGKALWGLGFMTLMAGDRDAAIPFLEQSLSGFRELGDPQGCARALLVLGNCKQFRGDPVALAHLERSATLARQAGDRWCLGHALALAGFEYFACSELPAARPLFEECLAVAQEADDKQSLRFGLLGLGAVCLRQGDYRSAQSLLEQGVALTDELGDDYGKATALRYLGELEFGRGDYGRATGLLNHALALSPEDGPPSAVCEALLMLATVVHASGDRSRARLLLEDALAREDGNEASTPALQCLGEMAVAEDDRRAGRRLFERARDGAQDAGDKGRLAHALHALGHLTDDAEHAAVLHHQGLELRRDIGDAPGIAASLESVAGLAASAGRHPRAARLLGAAKALRERGRYARVPWEAQRYEATAALVRQGLGDEELEAALVQGAKLPIDDALAHAVNGRGERLRPATGWASLTPSEKRIAALVAEGRTNREIAEQLCITSATVKNHLSHIFPKLGVARRSELAAEFWRAEHSSSARTEAK